MSIQQVTLDQMANADGHALYLDVRTPAEYASGHWPNSINLPLSGCTPERIQSLCDELKLKNATIYLICASGKRSQMAATQLNGVIPVCTVEGGLASCTTDQLQSTAGRKIIPLERQVRIAAGSLVLAGVVIGFLVHPAGFGLSGFVGAGLVFAGITDTCGMGILLSRMPWNQA